MVGFDDMPIARDVTPALTTVRLPLVEMGARAMTLALGTHRAADRASRRSAAELVVRDSTGPARPRALSPNLSRAANRHAADPATNLHIAQDIDGALGD